MGRPTHPALLSCLQYAMLLSLIFLIVLVAAVVGFVFRHEVSVPLTGVQQWGLGWALWPWVGSLWAGLALLEGWRCC